MYIQTTTKCNMTCDHCCFACTNKGENMDFSIYWKAVEIAKRYGHFVTIGGGEPTLHPHFYDFVDYAIDELYFDEPYSVHIITNGKIKKRAFWLIDKMDEGLLTAELSLDHFHDPIDWEVEEAFKDRKKTRTVDPYNVLKQGRAEEWTDKEGCACQTLFFAPNGDVKACGCLDSPVLFNIKDMDIDDIEEELDKLYEQYDNVETDGFGYACHRDLVPVKQVA